MSADLTITLEGEIGEISAASVHSALGCCLQLLEEAGTILGASGGRWNIAELRIGSAVLALENPAAPGVAEFIGEGLQALSRRPMIPSRWSDAMVRKARDLSRLAGSGGVTGVAVTARDHESLSLSASFTSHAQQAVAVRELSIGTVRGLVDKWEERRGHQIGLSLENGETIVASYPGELDERIKREALGRRIEARGQIHRNASGQRVRLTLEDFAVLSDERPASIDDLAGLYRELGDAGMTPMDVLAHRE